MELSITRSDYDTPYTCTEMSQAPQKDVQLLCVVKLCLSFPEPGLGFSSQCPWPWDRHRGSLSHSIIGHKLKLSLAWTLFLTEQTQGGC